MVTLSATALAAALLLSAACGAGEEPSAGSPGLGDPLYPGLGNGGYEVAHYTVTLDVDVDSNFVSGKADIEANATQALSSFNLDMRGLTVLETRVSDRPANHSRSGNELTIAPDAPIRNGEAFTVEVLYEGQPTPDEIPVSPVAPSSPFRFPHAVHRCPSVDSGSGDVHSTDGEGVGNPQRDGKEIHRRRESADAANLSNSSGASICYHRGLSKGHLS